MKIQLQKSNSMVFIGANLVFCDELIVFREIGRTSPRGGDVLIVVLLLAS